MSKWKEAKEAEERQQEEEERLSLEQTEETYHEIVEESELLRKFKERHEKESKRRQNVTDSNYYFVVCFSNSAQLREFCEKFRLNPDQLYVDGREFAKNVNRALSSPDTDFQTRYGGSKDYADRAMKMR